MNRPTCETCRFEEGGLCHRLPPAMVPWPTDNQHPIMYDPAACFPFVGPKDWCGEHKPKE